SWATRTPTVKTTGSEGLDGSKGSEGLDGSGLARTARRSAAPATVAVSVPAWSQLGESGKTPSSGSSPWLGLSPTTPQYAAGIRTEPPVSVPRARSHTSAATSAADPPDDPPEVRHGSRGLRVSPTSGCAN